MHSTIFPPASSGRPAARRLRLATVSLALLTSLAVPVQAEEGGFGINVFEKPRGPWELDLGSAPYKSTLSLSTDSLMNRDSQKLTVNGQQQLERLAGAILVGRKVQKVRITAHTDSVGEAPENLALTRRQAQAVAAALIARGVPEALIEPVAMGESAPVASNINGSGRAANRRIEIEVIGLREDLAAVVSGSESAAPEVGSYQVSGKVDRTALAFDQLFHRNSDRFSGTGEYALEALANKIHSAGAYREIVVLGYGYQGQRNSTATTQQAAEKVLRFLVDHGVDGRRATAVGLGPAVPITRNPADPRNARVVVEIHAN